MRMYVGVTDLEWYRFLSKRPDRDEINFWRPRGGSPFRAISPGELFLFKLKYPRNAIVGGGFFSRWTLAPIRIAWEAFGQGNGAPDLETLRTRIAKYRDPPVCPDYSCDIGCVILSQPFFFEQSDWVETPSDWKQNIVSGKTYDSAQDVGHDLFDAVRARLQSAAVVRERPVEYAPMFGDPIPVRPRLGQGAFRTAIIDTYQRRCAVTGEKVLPVLVAAHILPVAKGGEHRIDNGVLLRADVHELFDDGYVTIDADYRVRVSRLVQDEFHDGEYYLRLDKERIWLPSSVVDRPNHQFLQWHGDTLFKG